MLCAEFISGTFHGSWATCLWMRKLAFTNPLISLTWQVLKAGLYAKRLGGGVVFLPEFNSVSMEGCLCQLCASVSSQFPSLCSISQAVEVCAIRVSSGSAADSIKQEQLGVGLSTGNYSQYIYIGDYLIDGHSGDRTAKLQSQQNKNPRCKYSKLNCTRAVTN